MGKREEVEENKESHLFEDSIIVGIFHAKGHTVIPTVNPDNKVNFKVFGDVEKSIEGIYSNCPIGSLDVMRSIKLIRSMIFNLRQGGRR